MKKIILATITTALFFSISLISPVGAQFATPETLPAQTGQMKTNDSFDVVVTVANFVFALAFIFSIFGFLIALACLITAGGNERMLARGHHTWQVSLGGLIIALVGYILVSVIKNFFR